jgi:UDP-GlcNAc:undecaprenyl-phosphate GlcNAc-1-phosphate transferase
MIGGGPIIPTPLGPASGSAPAGIPPAEIARHVEALRRQLDDTAARLADLERLANPSAADAGVLSRLDIFNGYVGIFVVAFLVSLLATPLMRRLALAFGIVDRPTEARKAHRTPTPYLGGVAVWLGLMAAIFFSYTAEWHGLITPHPTTKEGTGLLPGGVPLSILLGMTVIMIVGLIDDSQKIIPRLKIAGQLVAAAALALENIGVKLAHQVLAPVATSLGFQLIDLGNGPTVGFLIPVAGGHISVDIVYWTGTALIAIFVLGACNASNLIDGLDGLLSGTTAIASAGLLIIALGLAAVDDGPLDGPRIVLCMALLGACMGFLPHNFNPASIFLGDAGSLLLGYCTIVIVMSLGDTGKTSLVLAGLIIYAIPIIDAALAIVRRKVAGRSISEADDQHLHHMLKRALGVRGAVLTLYLIAAIFATIGVALTLGRGRITYTIALVFAAFIGVTAFKIARHRHLEQQAADADARHRSRRAISLAATSPTPPAKAAAQPEPVAAATPSHAAADAPAPK